MCTVKQNSQTKTVHFVWSSQIWGVVFRQRLCARGQAQRVHIACSEKVVVNSPDASQASTASTSGLLCVYFGPILVVFRNLYCCQSSLSTTFSPRSLHSLRSSPPCALVTAWARCPLLLGCGVLLPPCLFPPLLIPSPISHEKVLCILEFFDTTDLYIKYKET